MTLAAHHTLGLILRSPAIVTAQFAPGEIEHLVTIIRAYGDARVAQAGR